MDIGVGSVIGLDGILGFGMRLVRSGMFVGDIFHRVCWG